PRDRCDREEGNEPRALHRADSTVSCQSRRSRFSPTGACMSQWKELKEAWSGMTYYQRFESTVVAFLSVVIALVVVIALYRLTSGVLVSLVFGALDPLDPAVFQTIFGDLL